MAGDDPSDESDGEGGDHAVDPADLTGASDADLADLAADAWAADGYRTTVKEHGSHVFVFAKRRTDGAIRGEIVWVAGERAVDSAQLDQLRALAEKTGADSAVCLSVGAGGVARSAAAGNDVSVVDGDDLRAKLGVDAPTDQSSGAASDDGLGDLSPPDDEPPGATEDGPAPPDGDAVSGSGSGSGGPGAVGAEASDVAGVESDDYDGGPSAGSVGESAGLGSDETGDAEGVGGSGAADANRAASGARPSTGRRCLDAWDGQTTEDDVRRGPFDGLWGAVTRGEAVGDGADLTVWDDTSR